MGGGFKTIVAIPSLLIDLMVSETLLSVTVFIDFCFATPNGINAATAGGDTTLILII